jgi:hypothetical protein
MFIFPIYDFLKKSHFFYGKHPKSIWFTVEKRNVTFHYRPLVQLHVYPQLPRKTFKGVEKNSLIFKMLKFDLRDCTLTTDSKIKSLNQCTKRNFSKSPSTVGFSSLVSVLPTIPRYMGVDHLGFC